MADEDGSVGVQVRDPAVERARLGTRVQYETEEGEIGGLGPAASGEYRGCQEVRRTALVTVPMIKRSHKVAFFNKHLFIFIKYIVNKLNI